MKTRSITCRRKTGDGHKQYKHRKVEKSSNKERAIIVQFLFCKDKINILRNFKKLEGTKDSIFKTLPCRKEKWYYPTENKVGFCTSSIEVLFVRKGKRQYNQLSDFL